MRTPYRFTLLSGTAVYATLALFAWLWYRERMLFSDMAFQSFQILRTGSLQIQSGRFGAAGTQVFPWLAQMAGLPLKSVLLSYSLGHVLYYFFLFLWIMRATRGWAWALILVLCSVLMTTHTFYWLSEAPQGLAFLVALLAWMDTRKHIGAIRWWQWPLFAAGLTTAFYFHPMVLYAMTFACVWLFLNTAVRAEKIVWATGLGLFGVLFFIKFKILPLDWYDAMSLSRANAFRELWPHWLDIRSNRDFGQWLLKDYYLLPVFYLLNLGILGVQKRWKLAAWTAVFPLLYLLLVNIPFHQGDNQFYLENLYLPLGLMVALPFVLLSAQFSTPKWFFGAFIAVALVRLGHIAMAHQSWTDRLHWMEALVARHPGPKNLIPEQDLPKNILHFTWGIPYETLLMTSLQHPDSSRLFFQTPGNDAKTDSLAALPHLFLGSFKHYPISSLPQKYFRPDQRQGYTYPK